MLRNEGDEREIEEGGDGRWGGGWERGRREK